MRKVMCAGLIALSMCGCETYSIKDMSGNEQLSRPNATSTYYIAVPADGSYGGDTYKGSGNTIAQAIAVAFSPRVSRVVVAPAYQSDAAALESAQNAGARYLVTPVISLWEKRLTQWTGVPSKITFRVTISELPSQKVVSATAIEGRSRVVAFTSTGPEYLLASPLEQYTEKLFGPAD